MKNIKDIKKEIRRLIRGKEKGYFFNIQNPYYEYENLLTSNPSKTEELRRKLQDTILLASLLREKKRLQESKKYNINLKFRTSLFWEAIYEIKKEKNSYPRKHYYNIPPFVINEDTVHILNHVHENTPISIKNINKETLKILINFTANNPYSSRMPQAVKKIFYTHQESLINIIKEEMNFYAKNNIESLTAGEKALAVVETIYQYIIKCKKNKERTLATPFLDKKNLIAIPMHIVASIAKRSYILHKEDIIQLFFYMIKNNKKNNPYDLKESINNIMSTIQTREDLSLLEVAKNITQIKTSEYMLLMLRNISPTPQDYEDIKQAAYHLQIMLALQNKHVTPLINKRTEKIIEALLLLKDYIRIHPQKADIIFFKIIKSIVNQNHIAEDIVIEKAKHIARTSPILTNRRIHLHDIIDIAETTVKYEVNNIVTDTIYEIINEKSEEEKNTKTDTEVLVLVQQTLPRNLFYSNVA